MGESLEIGERFARLLAAKRWTELAALLDPDITFNGMTPRRFWEARTPDEAVAGVG